MNSAERIKSLVKKILFRKKRDVFKQAFREFSKSLMLIVDLNQLKENVIAKIKEIVNVDTILIYLFIPDLNIFKLSEARGFDLKSSSHLYFIPDEPLIRWFTINQAHLIISKSPQIFLHFNERERKIINETEIEFIFPLIVMNRINGLICLGKKTTGERINDEDVELLTTLLSQSALAFENAYLYQQQKNRLKRMYRADKLATLGQLSAGAAHEIRNPLTSIRSTIQYLKKSLEDESNKELVEELLEEVDRINDIIEGLLSFSKPSKPLKERTDLHQLMLQSLHLVETTAKKRQTNIEYNFNSEEKFLKADPSQLKQVFLNIIMNSIQAIEESGEIIISVDLQKKIEPYSEKPHDYFILTFRDNGIGIPQRNLEHIFDPFFTTKKDGTGLGLSISYGIVQQHAGEIEIESSTKEEDPENFGTKVSITLPI